MVYEDISLNTELSDVARLFYGENFPHISMSAEGNRFAVEVDGKLFEYVYDTPEYDAIPIEHRTGRLSKIALYDALSGITGRKMPWGALTGVRPTKLFYELLGNGYSHTRATELMQSVYRVDVSRACILRRIEYAQRGKIFFDGDCINLYVHIPYCTTRCSYCSFVSSPIDKFRGQSREYVDYLCKEICESKKFLADNGLRVLSVYVGGGTPTALDGEDLERVLDAIGNYNCEYTCEAGRPDTIDKSKIEMLKNHGVTRICVNPQTLCNGTLEKIGRKHTAEDFYSAYAIASACGFDINCDLIAGLPDETVDDFAYSFEAIKKLKPCNITVHSLSKKNGSALRYSDGENSAAPDMIEYALENPDAYRPYYLYRQKRQVGNLENIGFSVSGKECINNITVMEETVGVMACGAGAISKFVGGKNIARFANMRDVPLYLSRFDEKLNEKLKFFSENI